MLCISFLKNILVEYEFGIYERISCGTYYAISSFDRCVTQDVPKKEYNIYIVDSTHHTLFEEKNLTKEDCPFRF